MTTEMLKSVTDRFIKKYGEDGTLTQYSDDGEDSYNDTSFSASDSTVKFLWDEQTPTQQQDASGNMQDVDATAVAVSSTAIEDAERSSSGRADELTLDGKRYKVLRSREIAGVWEIKLKNMRNS